MNLEKLAEQDERNEAGLVRFRISISSELYPFGECSTMALLDFVIVAPHHVQVSFENFLFILLPRRIVVKFLRCQLLPDAFAVREEPLEVKNICSRKTIVVS